MSVSGGAPGDEVPEADWAEQIAEAGPSDEDQAAPSRSVDAVSREADEADVVEQESPVDFDDEE